MSGISESTTKNLLYGTDGYLTIGGTGLTPDPEVNLGATKDDFSIEWQLEIYHPDIAQARVPVSGTGRAVGGSFKITATLLEWNFDKLRSIMAGFGYSDNDTHYYIGGGTIKEVPEVDNVKILGMTRNDGKAVQAVIERATVEVGNITLGEKQETGFQVTFTGVATASTGSKLPGYIVFEK